MKNFATELLRHLLIFVLVNTLGPRIVAWLESRITLVTESNQ